VTELSTWLACYAAGSTGLRVLVMSGPSGCGKLSTLQAMFPDSSSSSSSIRTQCSAQSAALPSARLHVLHGTEAGVEELSGFLGQARLRAQQRQREGDPEPLGLYVVKGLPGDGSFGGTFGGSEGSFSLRNQSLRVLGNHLQQLHEINNRQCGARAQSLTVFLCTIHDVHSEKVALGDYFGASFISSPLVQRFRCTSVTEKNMAARLQSVAKQHGIPPIDAKLLALLCDSAHGDMRQALLQLQWALLTATPSAATVRSSCPADRAGAGKRGRNGPVASRAGKKKAAAATVLDLIEDADDGDSAPTTSTTTENALLSSVFCRDECINIAHGAARLLSQKYTLEQLRSVLSVPPWKVYAFFVSNLPGYFHPYQIAEYASVASIASQMEPAVLQLTERAFAASRATDEDHLTMSVGEMAVAVLCTAYRILHRDVRHQTTFAAHSPPPFQPFYFPRFINRSSAIDSSYGFSWRGGSSGAEFADEEEVSERKNVASYFKALGGSKNALSAEYGLVREHVMAADRRTCPLCEFILDYYPFAKVIVLDDDNGAPRIISPPASKPPLQLRGAGNSGVKKTPFAFAASPPRLRPIAETTFAALTCFDARLHSLKIRGEYFCVRPSTSSASTDYRGPGSHEDDDIEDFSD
jgi:hypothetical protein